MHLAPCINTYMTTEIGQLARAAIHSSQMEQKPFDSSMCVYMYIYIHICTHTSVLYLYIDPM